MQVSSGVRLVDIEALDELRNLLGEKLDVLFDSLEQQGREALNELQALADDPGADSSGGLKKTLHKLKGSALSLYCNQLAEHCAMLEQMDFRQSTDFHALLTDLEHVLTTSLNAIADWKSSSQSR